MLPSSLIPIIGVLVVVLIAVFGFTTRGYTIHALLLAAPLGIYFINRPERLLVFIFGIYASQLIVPGIPQGLQLVHVMMALLIAITIARNTINKPRARKMPVRNAFLYLLLLLLIITIRQRGLGLHAAGSGLVGGASYIKLFIGIGFLLCAPYYTLTVAQIKRAILFILIGSFAPALAQVVYLASQGTFYYHFMFIQPYVFGLQESLQGMFGGQGEFRLHAFAGISINLLSLALVMIPYRGSNKLKILAVVGIAMGMALLSGFRTSLLEIFALTILFLILNAPANQRIRLAVGFGALMMFALVLAIPLTPHLPYSAQRALSWLPFTNVSIIASADAAASSEWRIDVWKYSLSHWKDYMWIGRGFTMRLSDLMAAEVQNDMITSAYVGHNYHSGPISMLLDLGIPGVIIVSGLLLSILSYACKPLAFDTEPIIARAHDLFRAKLIYSVIAFYLIHGDVRSTLITILLNVALLETIRMSARPLYGPADTLASSTQSPRTS